MGRDATAQGGGLTIAAELESWSLSSSAAPILRRVECLSGCRNPCNIRISSRGKASYWLSGIELPQLAELRDFITAYARAPDGIVGLASPPGVAQVVAATIPSRASGAETQ
jgi:predicted metal-binding protein